MPTAPDDDKSMRDIPDHVIATAAIATVFIAARIASLRGQPMNKGDMAQAVTDARALLEEVVRQNGPG